MLASIGERPVNNLTTSQRLDVIKAVAVLNEANVMAQTRGWWFNEELQVTLAPNTAGEYDLEPEVVKVDAYYPSVTKYVQRGLRLYNTEDRTYTGNTDDLLVDYTVLLPFNDCPETFRAYVARRAGVVYQKRSLGSVTLFEFTQEDAAEAWATLLQDEADQEDNNLRLAPDQVDLNFRR
jgi:hypothetical protein